MIIVNTCDPDYVTWNKLMGKSRDRFLEAVPDYEAELKLYFFDPAEFKLEGYWNIVLKRMVKHH